MKLLSLIICLILTVGFLSPTLAVTDAELEALEKQIEQQEEEEKQRQADEEKKRLEEEKRLTEKKTEEIIIEDERKRSESEAQRIRELEEYKLSETERKRKEEEEKLRAEKKKQETYNKHIKLAKTYMAEDKFDMAIDEYQIVLNTFPEDVGAKDGISEAQKYLNACDDIVGTWNVEPNGITWVIHNDNKVFGTWLIFSANGFWECMNARKKEVVVRWPDCAVCFTEYFYISDDGNTLQPSRGAKSLGKRIVHSKSDTKQNKQPEINL